MRIVSWCITNKPAVIGGLARFGRARLARYLNARKLGVEASAVIDDIDEHCYGMLCALELLSRCDEVWVAEDFGISQGMEYEIQTAKKLGIPVRYFSRTYEGGKE